MFFKYKLSELSCKSSKNLLVQVGSSNEFDLFALVLDKYCYVVIKNFFDFPDECCVS
jgi:hypothetical protein